MPKANDSYVVILKKAHLKWGIHRYTFTRGVVYGEGYLKIPRKVAEEFEIHNSNDEQANIEYTCSSLDGFLDNVKLKASGSSYGGDVYAKQFQGSGDLKILGDWYAHVAAKIGDKVRVQWTSPSNMLIQKL